MILFHQFFDPTSCTLSYLLADPLTGDAVIIDSVKEHVGAYVTFLQEQELQLGWVLETHIHADHITGAAGLRELTGARSAVGASGGVGCADRLLSDGDNNWVTQFEPDEAADVARALGVKVYTVLVGREDGGLFGEASVNPATLRRIAQVTGGEFFRATDYESFDRGFQAVRRQLDKTKRIEVSRVPDRELFVPLALLALALVLVEAALASTWLRRLP